MKGFTTKSIGDVVSMCGFPGSFKKVSRKFHGNFKGVSRKFQGLKGISCSFKWFLRVFERSSTGVSGKFQWCFKGV